jgi:hypothetical protein
MRPLPEGIGLSLPKEPPVLIDVANLRIYLAFLNQRQIRIGYRPVEGNTKMFLKLK